jgi:hypothetical protein
MSVHESGYDDWPKMPVLIDWNLGNFSVEFDEEDRSRFRLFSRWDYDWFRIESRLLDFYFLSRVSSRTGDRSAPATAPASPTACTRCSNRGSGVSCGPITPSIR